MPLSRSGWQQAEVLTEYFLPKSSGFTFSQAYCSPLKRTHQTGDKILTANHDVKSLEILEFLTEIDYGIDENKPEEDVIARLGKDAIERWDKEAMPPEGWNVNPHQIIQEWKSFFKKQAQSGHDILVVTSNGIARFALDAVDEVATDAPRKLRTAAYGIVEIENNTSKITAWNKRAPAN